MLQTTVLGYKTYNRYVCFLMVRNVNFYSMFSNGGQAVWDGNKLDGSPVISGVYYVFATSQDGYSSEKSKLLIVR